MKSNNIRWGTRCPKSPRDPIIRTVPQPADMNGNGDIFGGWVLSQMDIAGGTLAARVAKGRVATVAITAMTFVQPIKVGDLVSIYGEVSKIGRSSITIALETVVQRRLDPTPIQVTHGTFVFVAIDDDGKPRQVKRMKLAALALAAALAPRGRLGPSAHVIISQTVRAIEEDGAYTHVEIEWRFDPVRQRGRDSGDRRGQGRQDSRAEEIALLVRDTLPELAARSASRPG